MLRSPCVPRVLHHVRRGRRIYLPSSSHGQAGQGHRSQAVQCIGRATEETTAAAQTFQVIKADEEEAGI